MCYRTILQLTLLQQQVKQKPRVYLCGEKEKEIIWHWNADFSGNVNEKLLVSMVQKKCVTRINYMSVKKKKTDNF